MSFITILQIIISLTLIVVVIFQNRGTDTSAAFGGGGGSYRSKKGIEKLLFYLTIALAVGFASLSILSVVI